MPAAPIAAEIDGDEPRNAVLTDESREQLQNGGDEPIAFLGVVCDVENGDYVPVDLGYSEEQARREAARCLQCGVCVECYECERVCEPGAVLHAMTDTVREIEVGQILVSTGFQQFDAAAMPQYGYGRLAMEEIDALEQTVEALIRVATVIAERVDYRSNARKKE